MPSSVFPSEFPSEFPSSEFLSEFPSSEFLSEFPSEFPSSEFPSSEFLSEFPSSEFLSEFSSSEFPAEFPSSEFPISEFLSEVPTTDESQCDKADWVESLDRAGWSKCPQTNTYLKGLWRNDRKEGDERVGRIEYGRCCQASEEAFANQPAVCNNANWRITLDGSNVWALCPGGYFLNGLRKSDGGNLHNIEEGQCCRPQNQLEDDYDECYDEDVGTSFDNGGWSECQRAGYYMTGIYKSSCDEIYCIEKFKCCRMKTLTVETGHYRAFGRVIHLQYLQERLTTQNGLNFDATRQTMDLVDQMDILADTVYIEGNVLLHGIRNVKIYAREIIASPGSRIDFSAPNWNQVYQLRVVTGSDGEDGKHGTSGPQVEIFCDVINGALEVISNGGDGHKGQDGGNGAVAQDSHDRNEPNVETSSDVPRKSSANVLE
ncbi:hypothetical protein ACROYT_G035272 [Oculina patagonica]